MGLNIVAATDKMLKFKGMHPDCVDASQVREAFGSEMEKGLAGKKSSLLMLPTYLSGEGRPAEGETAVAVDIGGTNLRVALIRMKNGQPELLESGVSPVPGLKSDISKEEFFRDIAVKLLPVIHRTRRVGVCFSHPAEILPNRDGRLISFSKEIKVRDAAGMEICRGLADMLRQLGVHEEKRFILLNDTAAVLFSGMRTVKRTDIGLVLGTGLNIGYVEKTSRIGKLRGGFHSGTMIVNTEAGCFDMLPTGDFDRALDARTDNPGDHILEKMTSGAYLGALIGTAFHYAGDIGLLSDGSAKAAAAAVDNIPLPDAGRFLADQSGPLAALCRTEDDTAVLHTVIDRLVERAVKLVGAAVGAVAAHINAAADTWRPLNLAAEGSTIGKLHSFAERYVAFMMNEPDSRRCDIGFSEDATLYGTGLAALLNC